MKQLFPPEIIEYTAESHFAKQSRSTSIIYLAVLFALVLAIAVLPFIKIDVTTQSRGIVKSATENNQLQAAVYGEIEAVYLAENKYVIGTPSFSLRNEGLIKSRM